MHINNNMKKLYKDLKIKLENIEKEKAKGAAIRARIQWRLEGEKCSKFFCGLEKQKLAKQLVTEINGRDGLIKTEPKEILTEFENYYKNLYKHKENDKLSQISLFSNAMVKKISKDENKMLEKEILECEIKQSLWQMKNNKSPGSDGLTIEFYKCFFDIIKKDLTKSINNVLITGEMSNSQKEALITCIFKKGNKNDICNWRPISLTNVDYKILTKCLANRLKNILPNIIHSNQTACIKNRTMNYNLSYTRDIISIAKTNNLDACMLSIDQVKAFDRVDRDFLFDSLQHFGFAKGFIFFIKTIYNKITARIKINGLLSEKIDILRGVRQGCPLSMILYIIQAEIFSTFVRQNKKIKGIHVEGSETKIQQYADDTNFFLTGDDSIKEVGKALKLNKKATGAKINLAKCKGIWLGKNILKEKSKYLNFNWEESSFKSLGITFSNNGKFSYKTHWKEGFDKMESSLRKWEKYKLSLKGKKTIINTLIIPQVLHLAFIVPIPSIGILNKMEARINNFFWGGKICRLNKIKTQQKIKSGGAGLQNLTNKLKAIQLQWISKLYDEKNDGPWKDAMVHILNCHRNANQNKYIFETNPTQINQLPPFYAQLLVNWHKIKQRYCLPLINDEEILNQLLFFNKKITIFPKSFLTPENVHIKNDIVLIADVTKTFQPGFLHHKSIDLTENELENITKALPREWRQNILTECQNYDYKKAPFYIAKRKTKYEYKNLTVLTLYKLLNKPVKKPEYKFNNWETYFESMKNVNETDWKGFFQNLSKRNTNNKASEILFKIAHFILPTNEKMFDFKVTKNKICPQCKKKNENIAHMMYECEKVQPLSYYVLDILDQLYPLEYPHINSFKFILFGYGKMAGQREFGTILLEALIVEIYFNRMICLFENKVFTKKYILKKFDVKVKKLFKNELFIIIKQNNQDKHKDEIRNIFSKGKLNLVADIRNYFE
ncbi:MAG: reverse transcriptase family protein [Rickettsiales bacterium]|nr:reverse transcriptase family protein [Rickettsiales bacterium]